MLIRIRSRKLASVGLYEPLELTDDMIERNDEIDNAVHECICILTERDMDWDMELINDTTDAIKDVLGRRDINVRHPGVCVDDDGNEYYQE